MNDMMTWNKIDRIAMDFNLGMDFTSALALATRLAKRYDLDIDVTTPTDDDYGYILIGNRYSDSVTLDFDDDNNLYDIDVVNGDDLD